MSFVLNLAVDGDPLHRRGQRGPRRSASASASTASVWTKQSIVAKPGSIIPAPFAWAETVTPPRRSEHIFGPWSVVIIARVNPSAPSGASPSAASRTPRRSASTSSGTPITPVSPIATDPRSTPERLGGGVAHRAGVPHLLLPRGGVGV